MDEATTDDSTVGAGALPSDGAAPPGGPAADLATTLSQDQLDDLALELGVLVSETEGVARVHARPGAIEIARQAVGGLTAVVASVTARAGVGVPASTGEAAGRPQAVVTLAVTDDETRVVLDVTVHEAASGPAVARAVAARLLAHLEARALPAPTIDVRIVGTSS